MSVDHRTLQDRAAAQGGVLSYSQVLAAGYSLRMIRRRIASREWTRVLPGVLSLAGEPDETGRVHAAMLWADAGSVLVGASALWWWGITTTFPDQVSVLVPEHRKRNSCTFVRVSRQPVPGTDRVTERGIRVVSQPYAVMFAGRHVGSAQAQTLLDRALVRGADLQTFEQVLDRNAGSHGMAQARRLLRTARDGAAAESERLVIRLLRGANITGWRVNHRRQVQGSIYLPDFTFEEAKVIIEIDGWAFHSDPERFERDRLRQNSFVTDGWIVLRFTWAQLTTTPDQVLTTVIQALRSREHS